METCTCEEGGRRCERLAERTPCHPCATGVHIHYGCQRCAPHGTLSAEARLRYVHGALRRLLQLAPQWDRQHVVLALEQLMTYCEEVRR
jgi:hypothetical protein